MDTAFFTTGFEGDSVNQVLSMAVKFFDTATLCYIRNCKIIEQDLCHTGLNFFTKRPLTRCRIDSGWANATLSLSIFLLIICKVKGGIIYIIHVISNPDTFTLSFGFGSDHDYTIFGS